MFVVFKHLGLYKSIYIVKDKSVLRNRVRNKGRQHVHYSTFVNYTLQCYGQINKYILIIDRICALYYNFNISQCKKNRTKNTKQITSKLQQGQNALYY